MKHLVISAIGADRAGIVNTLSQAALDRGCNIEKSRMAVLGGEFALILLVTGEETDVTALREAIPALEDQLGLTLVAKATMPKLPEKRWLPYEVSVVAMDHPGIVHRITEYFSSHQINIEEMETETYAAPHTGTPMFALTMTVAIPAGGSLAQLKDDFFDLCDQLNLDASLDPARD